MIKLYFSIKCVLLIISLVFGVINAAILIIKNIKRP